MAIAPAELAARIGVFCNRSGARVRALKTGGSMLTVHFGTRCLAIAVLAAGLCGAAGAQQLIPPSDSQKKPRASNMTLVGYNDLQARSAYQPVVEKQGTRWIAYIGHHGGEALNPQTGKMEPNGTSIVDVTDPKKPKYLVHIPGEPKEKTGEFGGASMVRVCAGDQLPRGVKGKYYMLRAYGNTRHEMWDVTDPAKP